MSYGELAAASNRFANVLNGLGIAKGGLVCSLLGRLPALYVTALGTLKQRAVFSPLFAAFGPEPIKTRLSLGQAKVLVTTGFYNPTRRHSVLGYVSPLAYERQEGATAA